MKNKIIIFIVVFLAVIVGGFAMLNRYMVKDKKDVYENSQLLIKGNDKEVNLSLEDISKLGVEDFAADLKSNGKPAKEHTYTGVPVKALFKKANIGLDDNLKVTVRAIDGYVVTLGSKEILDEGNVYLAYKLDGETQPFQVILRKDQFSQRWCKDVVEIEINE